MSAELQDRIAALEARLDRALAEPRPATLETKVVDALERLIKIVDERTPIPVQVSPRGMVLAACYNKHGRLPEVKAALAWSGIPKYPGSPVKHVVLGVVYYAAFRDQPAFYMSVLVEDNEPKYANTIIGETPNEALRNLCCSLDTDQHRTLNATLLDMLAHGESERILS